MCVWFQNKRQPGVKIQHSYNNICIPYNTKNKK